MNTSTEGFQQCYNAQTAVDEAHQIIVATMGAQASDQGRLMPLLDEVSDSFGVEPEVVLADTATRRTLWRWRSAASMAMWHCGGRPAHPCGDASHG